VVSKMLINNYINIVKKENIFLQYKDDKRSI